MLDVAQETFRWGETARTLVRGRPLDGGSPAASRPERELSDLRNAIRSGREFAVRQSGIEILASRDMPATHFQVRSGGTTGRAKTIRRSHRSWIASFEVNRSSLGLEAGEVYGVLGLPTHSLALYAILEAAHLGAEVHQVAGMTPRRQADLLSAAGSTVLYATPAQLGLLADAGAALPSLRHVLCGGGRMHGALRERVRRVAPGAEVTEFYGAAETSFIAWGGDDRPEGSVGQAYPGVDIRIDAAEGETGEIWVASPYLFKGYTDGPAGDTRRDGRFLTVGEIGRLDRDGNLYVLGRKSRMVTVADQNVFPEDIEALLLSDPEVIHCAVFPVRDGRRGTVLHVAVAGELPARSRERLLRLCRDAFGPLAAPRRMVCLKAFPLTAAGKPDLTQIADATGAAK